jgi:hypothetical protein
MNKFNDDQIEVIKTALKNQEVVWSKNKQNRQYYDADLSELNQCLKIIKSIKKRLLNDRTNRRTL